MIATASTLFAQLQQPETASLSLDWANLILLAIGFVAVAIVVALAATFAWFKWLKPR